MRPVLYPIKDTSFTSYGLGEIDATLCKVTRERNGIYTLYMEYPTNGRMATTLVEGMKIKADAGVRTKWQTFEIVRVVKNSDNIIQVYAEHISQRTMKLALAPTVTVDGTAEQALRTWNANLIGGDSFDVWSDILTVNQTKWTIDKVKNARQALGGVEGSILDVWGGEYEFDNKMIRLHKKMGRTAPTVLEYGRNIISAEQEREISETYTSIVPYAMYTPQVESGQQAEPIIVTVNNYYIDSAYVDKYAVRTSLPVDFSSEFDDKTTPTKEALQRLAMDYIRKNKVGVPKVNTKVQYVDLASTLDYQQLKVLEEIELCDVVPIYFNSLDITNHDGKVIKIVFDVLKDENESIEVGEIGRTFTSTLGASFDTRISNIESQQKKFNESIVPYLLNEKGNRVWNITPDPNMEHKIGDVWFEKNGLYQRMKIWNGRMWEMVFDTEEMDSVEQEVNRVRQDSERLRQQIHDQQTQNQLIMDRIGISIDLSQSAKNLVDSLSRKIPQSIVGRNLLRNSKPNITSAAYRIASFPLVEKPTDGDEYTITIKGHLGEGKKYFGVYNSGGTVPLVLIQQNGTSFYQATFRWKSTHVWGTTPHNADSTNVTIYTLYADVTTESTIEWIKLEKGNVSTEYSPAWEDLPTPLSFNRLIERTDSIERRIGSVETGISGQLSEASANFTHLLENFERRTSEGIDRRIGSVLSQIETGYVRSADFNEYKETSQQVQRVLGSTESGIRDNIARLLITSEMFLQEVKQSGHRNLYTGTKDFSGTDWGTLLNWQTPWEDEEEKYKGFSIKSTYENYNGMWQNVEAKAGETYTFSFYAKCSQVQNIAVRTVWDNAPFPATRPVAGVSVLEQLFSIGTSWRRYSLTFDVTQDGSLQVRFEKRGASGRIYVCGIQLERGSIATEWTESVNEQVVSRLSQTEKLIELGLFGQEGLLDGLLIGKNNVRVKSSLIQLSGDTLIDNAFIRKAFIEDMNSDNITAMFAKFGDVIANNLVSNTITATRVKMLQALLESRKSNVNISGDGMYIGSNDGLDSVSINKDGTVYFRGISNVPTVSDFLRNNYSSYFAGWIGSSDMARGGLEISAPRNKRVSIGYNATLPTTPLASKRVFSSSALEIDGSTGNITVHRPIYSNTMNREGNGFKLRTNSEGVHLMHENEKSVITLLTDGTVRVKGRMTVNGMDIYEEIIKIWNGR